MDQYTITKTPFREYASRGGKCYYWRKIGTEEWLPYTEPQPQTQDTQKAEASEPIYLSLVRQEQPEPQGHHWLLFVAKEEAAGTVYQVKGDHTYMVYKHRDNIKIFHSASFRDMFHLAQLNENSIQRVRYWAENEPPPRAASQAEVKETCQSWTLRVIRRLVEDGMVHKDWCEKLQRMVDSPVLLGQR